MLTFSIVLRSGLLAGQFKTLKPEFSDNPAIKMQKQKKHLFITFFIQQQRKQITHEKIIQEYFKIYLQILPYIRALNYEKKNAFLSDFEIIWNSWL